MCPCRRFCTETVLQCLGEKEARHHIPLQTMLHVTDSGVPTASGATATAPLAVHGALRDDAANYVRACLEPATCSNQYMQHINT